MILKNAMQYQFSLIFGTAFTKMLRHKFSLFDKKMFYVDE